MAAALACLLLAAAGARAQANDRVAQLERAAALVGSDRLEEAERQLNQILKAAPEEAAALNLLGAVRAKQGRLDEAEAFFSRAVRADARLTGAHMNLAYLHLLRGRPEKTAAALGEVLRLEPSNAEAAYRLAWVLLSLGRLDECIDLAEKVRQSQTPSAPLLAVLGDAYLGKGDAGRAEESYRLALEREAANPDAHLGMARVARSRGDAAAVARHLGRAGGAAANSPELLSRLARVALEAGMKDEAVKALRRVVELRPGEASYHFALGAAWLRHPPDLLGAEQSFRESLRLRPGDARAQLLLGYVLLKSKKHAEARAWLEKSAAAGGGAPEAFYYLGLIAQGQNEDARAVELFEKSIRLAPSFGHAHVALGSTYLKLKDYERARAALEAGAKLNPEDPKAHYNLALLYSRLKEPERAREEMRIVERLKNEGKAEADGSEVAAPPPPQ
ncbi:MAG TPA: tetratricopeptide repeat protein [Pyrinomonadaceae bacterium]|nr:tetratricopeptide repeat protein [Pyrinomonadaceae bacterium]